MKKVEHELISDADMYLLIEKDMRDRVSYVSKKYSKDDNRYLKSYDAKQQSNDIIYLGANNLYGYAISKFHPTSGFKWTDLKEFDSNKYSSNKSNNCVLELDIQYPKELCK